MSAIETEILEAPLAAAAIISVVVAFIVNARAEIKAELARVENKAELARVENKAELARVEKEMVTRLFDVIFQSEYEQYRNKMKPISKAILKNVE